MRSRLLATSLLVALAAAGPARAQEEDEPAESESESESESGDDEDTAGPPPAPSREREGESLAEEADSEAEAEAEVEAEEASEPELTVGGHVGGEYRHRFIAMSDIPLTPLPRTDPSETGDLGQNYYGYQWLRLRGELTLRPILRLFGELDALWGIAYGDLAIGTTPGAWPREQYGYPGIRLRQLYLEWTTPIGLIRVGQMAFPWGLGMVSNGGTNEPVFGDYRFGDLVRRLLFATRPAGEDSPFALAIAGDWVAWDLTADFEARGDLAFQGVLAAFYEQQEDRVGGYVAYRSQSNPIGDSLDVFIADLFGQLHFPEPSGGRLLAAIELAYIRGTTTYTRTIDFPQQDVEQFMGVLRVGRKSDELDIILEGGFASGDSNTEDAIQQRATMDPDHRVGLILFPEVIAAQTARAAHLASSPDLFGRPARGAEFIPTNGGVAGAGYFFPYVIWRPFEWIEGRFGAVLAWSSADVVDPYAQRARSVSVNYRGGNPTRRDLGLELDGSVLLHGPLAEGVILSGGVEGGVFFPGRAFEDENGVGMDTVGLLRLRLGIAY